MKITHISQNKAGLIAGSSTELSQAIAMLEIAGYTVENIEDDADEPWHVATIIYQERQTIRTIKSALGLI